MAVVVTSYVIMFLLQPAAYDAAAAAARKRCQEHGWPAQLLCRRYRDTGSGLWQGFQQEFQITGTDPLMAIWVEVRRPLYAPFWHVADIVEEQVDLEPD
jgi:hypothetical protein